MKFGRWITNCWNTSQILEALEKNAKRVAILGGVSLHLESPPMSFHGILFPLTKTIYLIFWHIFRWKLDDRSASARQKCHLIQVHYSLVPVATKSLKLMQHYKILFGEIAKCSETPIWSSRSYNKTSYWILKQAWDTNIWTQRTCITKQNVYKTIGL